MRRGVGPGFPLPGPSGRPLAFPPDTTPMSTSSRPLAGHPTSTPGPSGTGGFMPFVILTGLILLGVLAVVVSFMRM